MTIDADSTTQAIAGLPVGAGWGMALHELAEIFRHAPRRAPSSRRSPPGEHHESQCRFR